MNDKNNILISCEWKTLTIIQRALTNAGYDWTTSKGGNSFGADFLDFKISKVAGPRAS